MSALIEDLLAVAVDAVRAAVAVLAPATHAGDTAADHLCDGRILDVLRSRRPDDSVLTEESGRTEGASGLLWVVDPLDGSANHARGLDGPTVNVIAVDGEGPVVAAVWDTTTAALWTCARGAGVRRGDVLIETSPEERPLRDSLVSVGFADEVELRRRQLDVVAALLPHVGHIRMSGVCGQELLRVTDGRIDGYVETHLRVWDYAAGAFLAQEAGARLFHLVMDGLSPGVLVCTSSIETDLRRVVDGAGGATSPLEWTSLREWYR